MRPLTGFSMQSGECLCISSRNPQAQPIGAISIAANGTVEAFDVKGLARQLAEIEAGHFFITIGQNSGCYLSPNTTFDRIVGASPSGCSERDLVEDLIDALEPTGVRLMVYLPSHAPAMDRHAVEALGCTPRWDASRWQLFPGTYLAPPDTDERLSVFQNNWESVIREWSTRWGAGVHGWWIDGCYHADRMYRHTDAPNFGSFAAAMKTGNPDSIVAFNPGVRVPITPMCDQEDYTAGEINGALPTPVAPPWHDPIERFIKGAQYHILTIQGGYWGRGEPQFSDETFVGYTRDTNRVGGVVTWDVRPEENGHIAESYMRQLRLLRDATRG